MIKKLSLINIFFLIYFLTCSTSVQMLPEPTDNKNLLVGSVILDIDGYEDNFLAIQHNIEVPIVGRYEVNGRYRNFGQWTNTDENGYFYIANVPDGEYAIKGFRINLIGLGEMKIVNELIDPERDYFELRTEDIINFSGNLFDTKSNQRVVNFKHNIFKLYHNRIINVERYDRIRDIKLSTGEIISSLPVPYYFIEKYEGSSWNHYLDLQLK